MTVSETGPYRYTEFTSAKRREEIVTIGKTFAEFAHDNNIGSIIYPDTGARPFAHIIRAYWKKRYPKKRPPETYFVNQKTLRSKEDVFEKEHAQWREITRTSLPPVLLQTPEKITPEGIFEAYVDLFPPKAVETIKESFTIRHVLDVRREAKTTETAVKELWGISEDASPEELELPTAIVKIAEIANSFVDNLEAAHPKDVDPIVLFKNTFPRLVKTKQPVLIVDNCMHTGIGIISIVNTLRSLGISAETGIISMKDNWSEINPTITTLSESLHGPAYKDTLIRKVPGKLTTSRAPVSREEFQIGRSRREDIRRIMQEHFD